MTHGHIVNFRYRTKELPEECHLQKKKIETKTKQPIVIQQGHIKIGQLQSIGLAHFYIFEKGFQ